MVPDDTTSPLLPESDDARAIPVASMVESIVGCKWSVGLLQLLADGCRRPSAILRASTGLSAKVMNERLRKMLRFGIVRRTVLGEKPPVEVEYVLTPFGHRFIGIIEEVRRLQEAVDSGAIAETTVHLPPERKAMAKLPSRAKDNPWQLKTPPGTSAYAMHTDEKDGKQILVCTVGSTVLHYDARCIDDLHAMLKQAGDWVELGGADEQKPAKEGTVEAWGRSAQNPVGGWYGLKKGLRGRFAVYVPPLMEALGLCELEHNAKNNRMRAKRTK